MRNPIRVIARSTFVALLGLTTALPASAQLPDETALPDSTLAVVKVKDASDLRAAIERSQFGQLLKDPELKDLRDDIETRLQDANDTLKQRLGVTIQELIETPDGPAWLAVTRRDDDVPFAVLLVADAGANADRMKTIMANATKELEQEGGDVTTEEFQGKTITVIDPPAEESPPLAWTNDGAVYYASLGVEPLKELLANLDGREDSLATNENYQAVTKKLGSADAQVCWYVDIAQILNVVAQAAAEQGGNAGQIEALLQAVGLNQLRAAGGTVDFATDEFDSVARTFIYVPGEPTGLLRMAALPAIAPEPEAWVPAEVSSYQSISWDIDEAYVAARDLINTFLPGAIDNIEQSLKGPNGETLSLENDITGPLGDRVSIVADFRPRGGEPVSAEDQRTLLAIALDDAEAFRGTLNKVFAIAGLEVKKREFQGTTVYDFELPELPAPPGAPQVQLAGTVSAAIAKDTFYVTGDATLLERVLRGGGAALADDAEFKAVAAHYPSQVSTFAFNRPDEQARAVYNLIKSGQFQELLEGSIPGGGQVDAPDLSEIIDVNKIPDFEVFAKYLAEGGSFTVKEDDGLTITQFTDKKSQ